MDAQEPTVIETSPTPTSTPVELDSIPSVDTPEKAETATEETLAEGEKQEETTGETERDEKGRFKPKLQERFDELTRQRGDAEREAAYWRAQATAAKPQTEAPAAKPKPTADQFSDYGEFIEALTDWKTDAKIAERMEQDSNRRVAESKAQTFQERQAEAITRIPDYSEVVLKSTAPVKPHVLELLTDSDVGPDLAYHFGKNPDVLLDLNRMSPLQAAKAVGALEVSLKAKAVEAPAAPTKKVTQAPTPANTSGKQGRATNPSLQDADMDSYMAQRKAQGARWAR